MPAVAARRIAALWSGGDSYLPTWAPAGVSFRSWDVVTDAGAGNDRLVVRFATPTGMVRWEVSDALEIMRKRAHLGCHGQRVSFRRRKGVETAWRCVSIGYRLMLSASQPRARGLSRAELERMVAGARPVPPGRARGSRYELPSPREVRRIAHAFRAPLFMPPRLPAGFVFSRWGIDARNANTGERRALFVTFGRDGIVIEWSVLVGKETFAIECRGKAAPGRVRFATGIHGASAWRCLPPRFAGNAQPIEIELWYDIRVDSPSMRRFAIHAVASARLVGRS